METAIELCHLSKIFRRSLPFLRWLKKCPGQVEVTALKNVTLSVESGEIFGIVGRNGQGKTTLIKILAGLIEPSEGNAWIFGLDPGSNRNGVQGLVGLAASDERSFHWRLTGLQNLLFYSRLYGLRTKEAVSRICSLMERFDILDLKDRRFHEYSSGNKQRLSIIRALLPNPKVLLLDEPTKSLDPISASILRNLIVDWVKSSPHRTVVITSHNLTEVEEICSRVAIMRCNQIVECATLGDLKHNYYRPETVHLKIRVASTNLDIPDLQSRIPGLIVHPPAGDLIHLSFHNRNGCNHLNHALSHLIHKGTEIVECNTERQNLAGILSEIEEKFPGP